MPFRLPLRRLRAAAPGIVALLVIAATPGKPAFAGGDCIGCLITEKTSTGNVGIGMTSPSYQLDISGSTGERISASTEYDGLLIENGTNYFAKIIGTESGNDYGVLQLLGGGTAKVSLTSDGTNSFINSGNVGIGTTAPGDTLAVIGQASAQSDASLDGFVQLWGDNALIWKYGNGNGGLRFGNATSLGAASYSQKMIILDNGNVGIGVTSPQNVLSVNGDVEAIGDNFVFNRYYSGGGWKADTTNASGQISVFNTYGGFMAFYVSPSETAGTAVSDGVPLSLYYNGSAAIGSGYTATVGPSNGLIVQGYVGIANTAPSYPLDVTGEARFTGGYTTSDRRLKTNIVDIGYGLDDVMKLHPVFFDWKKPVKGEEGRRVGFIAQEVRQVIPEVVSIAPDATKTEAVEYGNIAPVLVKAIQQLKADNDDLRARVAALEANAHQK